MARGTGSFRRGNGRGGSRFGYRGSTSFRGGRGRGRGRGGAQTDATPQRDEDGNQLAERFEQVKTNDEVDEKLGFARVQEGPTRDGWLINMHPVRTPPSKLQYYLLRIISLFELAGGLWDCFMYPCRHI